MARISGEKMTLAELIQKHTDVSGKWVRAEDVKVIIREWLNYQNKQVNETYTNYGQH